MPKQVMMTVFNVEALDFEDAVETAQVMTNKNENNIGIMTVVTGTHPEHGSVALVYTSFGDAVLLRI